MSKIQLFNGDCLEEMKKIKDKSIDLILTDPPYGTTECKWDNVIPFDQMWEQLNRIIKDNGAIVLFGSEPFSSALRMSNIKNFKYDWIWHKDKGANFATSKKQPLKIHEIISVFYKNTPYYNYQGKKLDKPYKHTMPIKTNGTTANFGDKNLNKDGSRKYKLYTHSTKKSIIYYPKDDGNKGVHPTQKPVALLEYLIKTYTQEKETVLDFTMGSGSTGVACKNLNRNFIGIELDKDYFNTAKRRIDEA